MIEALIGDEASGDTSQGLGDGEVGRQCFQGGATGVHEIAQVASVLTAAIVSVVVQMGLLGFQRAQERLIEAQPVGDRIGAGLLAELVDVVEGHLICGDRARDERALRGRCEGREGDRALKALALGALRLAGEPAQSGVEYLLGTQPPVAQLSARAREDAKPIASGGAGKRDGRR
ncbi:MAG TPA: hypothetical protein VGY76_07650 [Solirubrobacteraceae bacterium]|nr:hypothetical protein [Solirubrobacteraceae bacterium]